MERILGRHIKTVTLHAILYTTLLKTKVCMDILFLSADGASVNVSVCEASFRLLYLGFSRPGAMPMGLNFHARMPFPDIDDMLLRLYYISKNYLGSVVNFQTLSMITRRCFNSRKVVSYLFELMEVTVYKRKAGWSTDMELP